MKKQPSPKFEAAFKRCVKFFGSVQAMADALDQKAAQNVFGWRNCGRIPAEYCPRIEQLTGVRSEDLNPRVDWGFYRRTK